MKVTITGWIHATRNEWEKEYSYRFTGYEHGEDIGYINVCPHEFEFELPDGFNPVPAEIKALRIERARILAEAQAKAVRLDERIATLLAIEYKPEVEQAQ